MVLIPRKISFPPEELIVATNVTVPVDTSRNVAVFRAPDFGQYACWLRRLAAARLNDMMLWFSSDGRTNYLALNAGARLNLDISQELSVYCRTLFSLDAFNKTGASVSNYQIRSSYLVDFPKEPFRPPTLFKPLEQNIMDIIEVAERVTVAAGGEERVGASITVPTDQKAVLFELACERSTTPGDPIIDITRDGEALRLDLDCYAMPDLEYSEKLWIPAIDTLETKLRSSGGKTNYRVRYKVGLFELLPEEKALWKVE